ncbi:transaldolase family protein [Streptomyces sp. NPDC058619]|uniref:transaldolase family protein n=1 Tax=unclassified Streptomyces TaxID=2593676 RepID=UPI00365307EB
MGDPGPAPGDGVLDRLAAEGVHAWLDSTGRAAGPYADPCRPPLAAAGIRGVRGVLCGVDTVLESLLRPEQTYGNPRPRPCPGPGEPVEVLLAAQARAACDVLLRRYAAGRGADGLVAVPLAPWHRGADAQVAAARGLVRRVGRPNVLVGVRATPDGLAAVVRCLGEGLGVYCGPVFGAAAYEAVLEAWLTGLGRAHRAGLDLARIAFVSGPRLTGPPQAAADTARLLYACADLRYDDPRWPALVAAGARPHRLLWTGFDPATAAAVVPGLVGWGTGVALSGAALAAVVRDAVLRGETLGGAGPDAPRELALARRAVAVAEATGAAARDERRRAAVWSRARALAARRIRTAAGSSPAQPSGGPPYAELRPGAEPAPRPR